MKDDKAIKEVIPMSDQNAKINWYPGHMAKTKRLLQDQIKRIDLIIEICDARLPYSSRNPELSSMISRKRHLLFLNKSDLADANMNNLWIQYFRRQGTEAHLTNAAKMNVKETLGLIDKATKEIVQVGTNDIFDGAELDKIYHTFVKKLFSFIENRTGIKNITREPRIVLFEGAPAYDRGSICNLTPGNRMERILIKSLWQMSDKYRGLIMHQSC